MYLSTLKTSLSLMSLSVALAATLNGMLAPAYAAGPQDAATLAELKTQLEVGLPGANLRTGPGATFEVISTIDDEDSIRVTGRTENYWLQVEVEGQRGWLAGDLVENQAALARLPEVETVDLQATAATPEASLSSVFYGIGAGLDSRDGIPLIESVLEGGPARKVADDFKDTMKIVFDEFLPQWNYTAVPNR